MKKGIKFLLLIAMTFMLLTPTTAVHATEKKNLNYPENTTVYYNNEYYDTLSNALKAAFMDTQTTGIKEIHCKPNADVGAMTHGHVADDMIIYGNDAYVSSGERDLEIDTYRYNRQTGNQDVNEVFLEKDITVTVKELNGIAAWGQRNTNHTINLNFENCKNMQRIYFSGQTGNININLDGCSFDGENSTLKANKDTTIYSNANGIINVKNTTFNNIDVGLNLNHKMVGTQTIIINNTEFINCGQGTDGNKTYAAPVRIVAQSGAISNLSIENSKFTYSDGISNCGNGDILLGDGRSTDGVSATGTTTLAMSSTKAKVMVQKAGYHSNETIDESKATITEVEEYDLILPSDENHFEVDKHLESQFVDKKETTCTEDGNIAYYHCPICKKNFKDAQGREEIKDITVKATGHKTVKVDAKEPTCTENGNIPHYSCNVCGKLFDLNDKTEITKETTIIKAKGHTSDTGTVTKKPTVDAEGVKTYKCTVCGEVVKTESIAKLPMPKPEEPKLPSVDTSKPVDKVTVGVNDEKSSEVLENVSSSIVKDIIEGKDVKEVATLLVDESKVEEILANAKEVKSEVKVENKTEKEIDKKVIDTIDTKIESTIKENQTFEVAQYLDLSVLLTADGQALAQVNELDKSIQFTVKLPTDLLKANREFFVVRVHNGVATIIEPSHVTEDGVLTFETDAFSTYAIAYVDTKTSGDVTVTPEQPKPTDKEDKPVDTSKPTEKDETVKTDDENNMMLYASFAGLALVGGAILVLTKKREELMK